MTRGRKKKENAKVETISIKISKNQKILIENNKFIKKDIDRIVREYINLFTTE